MLSRRYLRIRVMQTLYAWHQADNKTAFQVEQELFKGTEKVYDLYLQLLSFFIEMSDQEEIYYADVPASAVTGAKKKATRHLRENIFIHWLINNKTFKDLVSKRKLSWQSDSDILQKAFFKLRKSEAYKNFSSGKDATSVADIQFVRELYKLLLQKEDLIAYALEEKNIYWAEGLSIVHEMIFKTIESKTLLPLYRDQEDDMEFMKKLVSNTIHNDAYFNELITAKTQNWEAERIALIDIILMKMALCEILNIPNIPVKVSINEYIDISKDYSTPNSKGFINGVIDKIVIDLRKEGKIIKTGRGLMEETVRLKGK